jgi:hypothetical protein
MVLSAGRCDVVSVGELTFCLRWRAVRCLLCGRCGMNRRADRWIRWTTIGCVGLLALIAGTVSYLHMHLLVELHGQPGWVAALTPLMLDGMIVAACCAYRPLAAWHGLPGELPVWIAGRRWALAGARACLRRQRGQSMMSCWPGRSLRSPRVAIMAAIRTAMN